MKPDPKNPLTAHDDPIAKAVYWFIVDCNGGFFPDNKLCDEGVIKLKQAFTKAGWKAPNNA